MTRDHLADALWLQNLAERNGYSHIKPLIERPGWYACLARFAFTAAIITGQIGDEITVGDRWCYLGSAAAKAALDAWSGAGEPAGWHRHPYSGRRRPDGDAAQEYIAV